jgi:hypothetical protein
LIAAQAGTLSRLQGIAFLRIMVVETLVSSA